MYTCYCLQMDMINYLRGHNCLLPWDGEETEDNSNWRIEIDVMGLNKEKLAMTSLIVIRLNHCKNLIINIMKSHDKKYVTF